MPEWLIPLLPAALTVLKEVWRSTRGNAVDRSNGLHVLVSRRVQAEVAKTPRASTMTMRQQAQIEKLLTDALLQAMSSGGYTEVCFDSPTTGPIRLQVTHLLAEALIAALVARAQSMPDPFGQDPLPRSRPYPLPPAA